MLREGCGGGDAFEDSTEEELRSDSDCEGHDVGDGKMEEISEEREREWRSGAASACVGVASGLGVCLPACLHSPPKPVK